MSDERNLSEFANAGGQPNQPTPHGHSLVRPTTGLADRVFGAQPVAKQRDEANVRTKLRALAAWAGEDWFYRFPVKNNKTGQTDYIQGPSIKLANNVAREFGNCVIEIREVDVGDAWTFYARFSDIETGFSMERSYHQRKGQQGMRVRDADRALDIAYSIGQSKAIRNVITNALGIYCDFAFEEAQNSLVNKIGKNLGGSRAKVINLIEAIPCELNRVERVIGRAAGAWTAPDIAYVHSMIQSITDGMANADDLFPSIEKVEQASSAAPASPTPPQSQTGEGGGEQAKQSETPNEAPEVSDSASTESAKPAPADPAAGESMDLVRIAFGAGIRAKNKDERRSAIPREYRDGQHDDLAAAWLAGYDGKELPTATTEK